MKLAARLFDLVARALAAGLAVSMLVAAWHDVSKAWDGWYYHLPFAARLLGIVDAHSYTFSPVNQARYEGFPVLAEFVQGVFWKIGGRPTAANLVALFALFALPVALRRAYRIPVHLSFLALLAIPLVQIHATASYIDLPSNAALTGLFLCVHHAWTSREAPSARLLAIAGACAVFTANSKFQLVPAVAVACVAMVVRIAMTPRRRRLLVLAVAVAPLVLATPIANAARHGNPVYPVELRVLGRSLPHTEGSYASSPLHLTNAPGAVRFFRSAFEIDNRPIASHRRWSLDQWTPYDEPGYRMGGFFGAYVAINLLALGVAAWKKRTRAARVAAGLFAVVTAIVCVVPQGHELRYYMHWMLLLVCLNLVLWADDARAHVAIGLVAIIALGIVAWSTEATYLYPSGDSFATLLDQKVDRSILDATTPGGRICVAKEPWSFLYAPIFHPERSYSVQEAAEEADCSR